MGRGIEEREGKGEGKGRRREGVGGREDNEREWEVGVSLLNTQNEVILCQSQ